jgi:hypothetical protein
MCEGFSATDKEFFVACQDCCVTEKKFYVSYQDYGVLKNLWYVTEKSGGVTFSRGLCAEVHPASSFLNEPRERRLR